MEPVRRGACRVDMLSWCRLLLPLCKEELATEETGESTGTGQKNFSVTSGCEVSHTLLINATQVQSL